MGLKDLARGGGRRNGSNSALAQRYLAAIDGDAIELVLPSQQPEHQRQPASPSGRSRSSHTTKSTKQTVRTVGCESSDSVWNETPTPYSPPYRRRPLQLEQHQSGPAELINASSEKRSNSASVPVMLKSSSPDVAHVSASKRGFFPRTKLRNVNSPPAKPEVSRVVVAERINSSKVSSEEQRPSPRTNANPPKTSHIHERHRVNNKNEAYDSDDGDSSLTSRRTAESKDSPYQSQRNRDHPLQGHFDEDTASSDESSLSYEDDANEIHHHSSQQDYRFYSERTKHDARRSSPKHINAVPKQTHFSIEKTFDQAFEKGLDMILNTNAWACTVPDSGTAAASPIPSSIPSSTKDTKRIDGRSQRNTVMTPPQRRKQRLNALRHNLSAETPKSDITGAETEIATNRAIDLALRRVREIENGTALSKKHAKQLTELENKTNLRATGTGHVKNVAMHFERCMKDDAKAPLLVCKRVNGGSRRFVGTQSRLDPSSKSDGKLNSHFLGAKAQSAEKGFVHNELSFDQTKSLSSSVGVEIGDRNRAQNKASEALETFAQTKEAIQSFSEREKHDSTKSHHVWKRKDPPNQKGSLHSDEGFTPRQDETQSPTLRGTKAATPLRPLMYGRPPISENYVAMDPCMSPPRIVRKSQSFDETSPDPVFCSKSMSMSIHSSQIFSPSTNTSDASFQSDDAMFMEKGDEASSTSNPNHKRFQTDDDRHFPLYKCGNLSTPSNLMKNPEISGHTEPTLVAHSDDETSRELEHGSSYLDLLGIRGSFPSTPVIVRPKSPLQHLPRFPVGSDPYAAPAVLSDVPSPPPLVDSMLNASRKYSADMLLAPSFESRKVNDEKSYKSLSRSTSSEIKNSSHTIIAKPYPVRSLPKIDAESVCDKTLKSSRFSMNSALAAKLSKTSVVSQHGDADVRSIDVKSIRSAFESIMSPTDQVDENDEEDTASVKSLRERFEPPCVSASLENGITKTRALFEKRSARASVRNDVALKARSERISVGDSIHLQRLQDTRPVAKKTMNVPNLELEDDDKDSRSLNEVFVDSSFERKSLSVADRIRAFGGGQKNKLRTEFSKSGAVGRKNTTTKSNAIHEKHDKERHHGEVSESIKRSPRRRISTLRAFGEKAFLCGPPKELMGLSDRDGVAKRNFEGIQPVDVGTVEAISDEKQKQNEFPEDLHMSPSTKYGQERDISTETSDRTHYITTEESQRLHSPHFAASKPTWMLQREKILSKSRQSSRVLAAAIESKRETALLLHDDETKNDVSTPDLRRKVKLDSAVSDVRCKTSPQPVEIKAHNVRLVTNGSVTQNRNDASLLNSEEKGTDVKRTPAAPKNVVQSEICETILAPNDANDSENYETFDQYFATPPPAYKLCRSLSENATSGSKRFSVTLPSENNCLPRTTAEFLDGNQAVNLREDSDEKKEEMPSDGVFLVKYFGEPGISTSASSAMSQHFSRHARNQVEKADESAPLVLKPVARKPYVRPVPIKPLVDSLPSVPFVRSVSDPTTRKIASTGYDLSQYCQILEDETRFRTKGVADKKYATLALPRLADSVMEPRDVYDDMNSCSEGSEFSDGVTLDLSIADVSNLTNPTAIVSKLGGKGHDDGQSESSDSADEAVRKRKKRNHELIDSEAKQSEASSSQTSEAAAPLLARALRTFPLSDEVSTDSFFRQRILVAKQKWSTRLDSQRLESGTENAKEDDSLFNDDLGGIWDIRQVESLFPISTANSVRQTKRISELDSWQPFSPTVNSVESPRNEDEILDPETLSYLSRSKTPTRRNTSRLIQPHASSDGCPESDVSKTSHSYNFLTESSTAPLDSEASYPLGSSSASAKTSRNLVGQLLTSALSGTTSGTSVNYSYMNSGNTASNRSTVSSSTVSNFGPKHSALLARIHALKESRLRRATRMTTTQASLRPTTRNALVNQDSISQSHYLLSRTNCNEERSTANGSVQSSNFVGRHKYVGSLELD